MLLLAPGLLLLPYVVTAFCFIASLRALASARLEAAVTGATVFIVVLADDEGCSPLVPLVPDEELVDELEPERFPTCGSCSLAEDEDELLRLVLPPIWPPSSGMLTGAATILVLLADELLPAVYLSFARFDSTFDSGPYPIAAFASVVLRFPPSANDWCSCVAEALVTTAVAQEVAVLTT